MPSSDDALIIRKIQKELQLDGSNIRLYLPDPVKDRELIEIYHDISTKMGKPNIPLAVCKGAMKDSFNYILNEQEYAIILGRDILKEYGKEEAESTIAHELGHINPTQIARTLKAIEIDKRLQEILEKARKKSSKTGDRSIYIQAQKECARISNTLDRFSTVDDYAADREAAKAVPAATLADTQEKSLRASLKGKDRKWLYPQATSEQVALEMLEKDLRDGTGTHSYVKRIHYLRNRAAKEMQSK